jgi:putative exosortase-associated protein (TIGR04073 family)
MLCAGVAPAFAAKHPGEKMARGFINVWNGQYEMTDQLHESAYYDGPAGAVTGFFVGAARMATRMVGGAYDIITFIVPFPANYKPVVEPELNF